MKDEFALKGHIRLSQDPEHQNYYRTIINQDRAISINPAPGKNVSDMISNFIVMTQSYKINKEKKQELVEMLKELQQEEGRLTEKQIDEIRQETWNECREYIYKTEIPPLVEQAEIRGIDKGIKTQYEYSNRCGYCPNPLELDSLLIPCLQCAHKGYRLQMKPSIHRQR